MSRRVSLYFLCVSWTSRGFFSLPLSPVTLSCDFPVSYFSCVCDLKAGYPLLSLVSPPLEAMGHDRATGTGIDRGRGRTCLVFFSCVMPGRPLGHSQSLRM
ncbi:hypothetical protein BDV59DRAFT_145732 [Aspergillus ambiguus]|uniref:uncharacterized protein n=1 Tax=Aspergillus ambiguus TaxID=176160 RepID=UPI003CCCADDD